MTAPAICLLVILASCVLGLAILLFLPLIEKRQDTGGRSSEIAIDSGESIVTVRKIGTVTSVTIRPGIRDHWEGSEGVAVPLLGPEATRLHEPALWAEYMDPSTSAIRKYEIIDEVYALGFTLPYEKELLERYERTPVNLTPAHQDGPGPEEYKKVQINQELLHEPTPDMGEDAPEPPDNQ